MCFPVTICTKLTNFQFRYIKISCTDFYTCRKITVESTLRNSLTRVSKLRRRLPNYGASRDISKYCFLNLYVLFFQRAITLLEQIVNKLFGTNYSINYSVSYVFWPRDAKKKMLSN
jgi:hypothetical protein